MLTISWPFHGCPGTGTSFILKELLIGLTQTILLLEPVRIASINQQHLIQAMLFLASFMEFKVNVPVSLTKEQFIPTVKNRARKYLFQVNNKLKMQLLSSLAIFHHHRTSTLSLLSFLSQFMHIDV